MTDSIQQLPEGWILVELQDISDIASGGTPSTKEEDNFGGNVPWITPADLSGFTGKWISRGKRNITERGLRSSSAVLLPKGTVVFSSRAPIGYVAIAANELSTNQGCKNFTVYDGILNEFLYYYLKANKELAERHASGTTFLELSASRAAKLPFPLPPLPEQHRIVTKIEELFTRLDVGVEALNKIKQQLKRYRQAVLKAAFEGKLTAEWRQAHKGELEPASVLLEKIKAERKKAGKYKEFPPLDTSDLPELPEGWVWVRVGHLYDVVGGGTPSTSVAEYWNGDIPWITSADINGVNDIRPRKSITKAGIENSATNLVPQGSLIVVTRVGLGKIALTKVPLCFSQDSQALVGNNSLIRPDYALYCLSKEVQRFKYESRGTTIAGVTKKQLAELPFAFPPFAEQQQIVEGIERHLSVADEIEKVVNQSLAQGARLRQSILKKAFEGKLVPQDPHDEPAEKLLERIKAEKARRQAEAITARARNKKSVTQGRLV